MSDIYKALSDDGIRKGLVEFYQNDASGRLKNNSERFVDIIDGYFIKNKIMDAFSSIMANNIMSIYGRPNTDFTLRIDKETLQHIINNLNKQSFVY